MIALLEMPLTRRLAPLVLALVVAAVTFELSRRRKLVDIENQTHAAIGHDRRARDEASCADAAAEALDDDLLPR